MRRVLIPLLLLVAVAANAQVRESIEVRLVELTVSVSDPQGNPVRDLKPEDFVILDEGRKQTITNFDVVDYGVPVPASARTPAARRNFLLLFDVTNSAPSSLIRARETALQFVSTQAANLDRIAVATISSQHGIHLLTSFTTDRELVTAAVKTLGAPKFYQPRDPLLISLTVPNPVEETLTEVEAAVQEFIKEITIQGQKYAADAARYNVEREISELTDLGHALDHVSGRKQVIYFSEGFDPKALTGRSSLSSQEARDEQAASVSGQIWRVDSDNIYGNTRAESNLRKMIEALRRSDVVLHAMDIKGLRTNVDASEGIRPVSNDSLALLSRETGGIVIKNSNELGSDLGRFLKSQQVTYSIGYRAQRGTPGKFRRLTVKVPSMPNATIHSRIGYYEPAPATGTLDRTLRSTDIIMNRVPVQDLKVTAYAAAIPQIGAPGLVPVVLEIDGAALLPTLSGAGEASAEIFIYGFDDNDTPRDALHHRMTFDLGKIKRETLGAGLKFFGNLRLQQGQYSIRALVRSAGQNGFVEIPVLVPASSEQYAAAPMLFGDMERGLNVRVPAQAEDPYPFHVADTPFIPATFPVLKPGVPTDMVLFLYNVPMEALQVKAAVGAHEATLALVGRTEKDDNGAVKLLMKVAAPASAKGSGNLLVTIGGTGADLQQVSIPVRVE